MFYKIINERYMFSGPHRSDHQAIAYHIQIHDKDPATPNIEKLSVKHRVDQKILRRESCDMVVSGLY